MQNMVFLIIVSDLNLGTQGKASCISIHNSIENLQNCGLTSTIVANQGNTLPTFDFKINICKQSLSWESLGKSFYSKYIISTDKTWFQGNTHLVINFNWFLNALDLVQHFYTALSTLNGFLTVKGAELGDNSLLMFDLSLLVQVSLVLGVTQLRFFQGISGIVAFVHSHLGSLDLHDLGNYLVQKITVMGNDKYSARVVEKIGLKPCNALHIQMVGRLVQKENIRFGNQKLAKCNPGFLTSGKVLNLFAVVFFFKSKTF